MNPTTTFPSESTPTPPRATELSRSVIFRSPVPSAAIAQRLVVPVRSLSNTIVEPSGVQAESWSRPGWLVSRVAVPPPKATFQRSPRQLKTTVSPSGLILGNRGRSTFPSARRVPVVRGCTVPTAAEANPEIRRLITPADKMRPKTGRSKSQRFMTYLQIYRLFSLEFDHTEWNRIDSNGAISRSLPAAPQTVRFGNLSDARNGVSVGLIRLRGLSAVLRYLKILKTGSGRKLNSPKSDFPPDPQEKDSTV